MKRKSDKPTQFERAYRILQYLKRNTDKKHPARQIDLRKDPKLNDLMGSQDTYNDTIHSMVNMLNYDENEQLLPEEEWQLIFDGFKRTYGSEFLDADDDGYGDDDDNESYKPGSNRIRNLYYNHIFSYREIDALIEGIWFSKTLSEKTRRRIVGKIKKHLTGRYYRDSYRGILSIREPLLADRAVMEKNLEAIRKAIAKQKKIAFIFNGYDKTKKLVATREKKHTVNPYYIVANSGRYYLIGGWDAVGERRATMCIYRIDLMSEVELLEQKQLLKTEVEGLPREWDDSFALSHMNMFYDKPERIRLKITCEPTQWTFLHDWFGDSFQPVGNDEVTVNCSPEAMVFWALQYCDRVEVLSPEHVRQKVAKKVQGLREKYGV